MATVRVTNELRDKIKNLAVKAFDLAKPVPVLDQPDVVRLCTAVTTSKTGQEMNTIASMLEAICARGGAVGGQAEMKFFGLDSVRLKQETLDHISVYFKRKGDTKGQHVNLEVPTVFMVAEGRWGGGSSDIHTAMLDEDDHAYFDLAFNKLADKLEARSDEFNAYKSQIARLLDGCNTYKQLLEAWPQVTAFTPQEILDRHNEKAEKRSRGKLVRDEIEFDTDTMNQVAVKAKLTGKM